MTVMDTQEGQLDAPTTLEMPCPACKGQGSNQLFLPKGWQTVHDMLTAANEVRGQTQHSRMISERQRLEQAWHDMQVAWKIAERIGLVQSVGMYWTGLSQAGFNNIVNGRVGDRQQVAPVKVPQRIKLQGEPSEVAIPCSRCKGRGSIRFKLTPEQESVIEDLRILGARKFDSLYWKYTRIREAAQTGAEVGLSQEVMAFALGMSRAGLIDILKAGR